MQNMRVFTAGLVLLACFTVQGGEAGKEWVVIQGKSYSIHFTRADINDAGDIGNWVKEGLDKITVFFGKSYRKYFDVNIFPCRSDLDSHWQKIWNMPGFKSQCWMVASGGDEELNVLSPGVWKREGCEHDPSDKQAIGKIIMHELVHVFHGQYNASPTFDETENIDWLIEGLATYVSGQLTEERWLSIYHEADTGNIPDKLVDIWKGSNRYGLAGSIVKYIDAVFGREKLTELLQYNKCKDVLNTLGFTEKQLITQWKETLK